MSSAGCYVLDVYCDVCGDDQQFTGRTEAESIRDARAYHWSIGAQGAADDGSRPARCPKHRGKRRGDAKL